MVLCSVHIVRRLVAFMLLLHIHCVLNSVTYLSCYNFDIHESILIIFGKNLTEKGTIKRCFIFSPYLTSSSALPGEDQKDNSRIFYSDALHDSLNFVLSGIKLWTVMGP